MSGEVSRRRRPYDSSGRQAQASLVRARVLEAAGRLFIEQGYGRTSMTRIAAEAGVSTPTVFAGFRTKSQLLKAAVDTAIVGDDEQVPLAARPVMRRVHEATTLPELVERLADAFAEVAERAGPIAAVAYAAADADAEVAHLATTLDAERLTGAHQLAVAVATRLQVTDPAATDRIRDTIWTLNSVQQWHLLTRQRGWTTQAYRDWMVVALTALCTHAAGPTAT
ncbi:TetR/AcrR family transcriptional regulator [Paractinoplanes maris]|uniref:TetR/AcrR family transcriptional regulator n=1 Tax=Paractinoplanes maris TaxID=1734446 RepID=UPI002021BF64|nr:helix-turn-helix domain-containing protein [Actinoplanes maris]